MKKKLWFIMVVSVNVSLMLAACAAPAPAPAPVPVVEAATAVPATEAPAAERVLTIGMSGDVETLDSDFSHFQQSSFHAEDMIPKFLFNSRFQSLAPFLL